MIAIQYLQPEPGIEERTPQQVLEKLHEASDNLTITHLLIGWNIPVRLVDACREETLKLGIRLYRWQPLLSGDGVIRLLPEWRVRNMNGNAIASPDSSEEFAFVCPNHPSVLDAVQGHIQLIINQHHYDGLFLDRIRFPGLGNDILVNLACFCEHCKRRAEESGIELDEVKTQLKHLAQTGEGRIRIVQSLFGEQHPQPSSEADDQLLRFLQFRRANITRFVQIIAEQIQQAGLQVGLDCFTPSLAGIVGQDLRTLDTNASWLKVMTYAHVNAPAGMPYELGGMADWLMQSGLDEKAALVEISRAAGITLPLTREELYRKGLISGALKTEISRGVLESSAPLLAGIELVGLPGISELSDVQIAGDLQAILSMNPAGLALSWDLWHIPTSRLQIVAREQKSLQGF